MRSCRVCGRTALDAPHGELSWHQCGSTPMIAGQALCVDCAEESDPEHHDEVSYVIQSTVLAAIGSNSERAEGSGEVEEDPDLLRTFMFAAALLSAGLIINPAEAGNDVSSVLGDAKRLLRKQGFVGLHKEALYRAIMFASRVWMYSRALTQKRSKK